ncbi:MAG: S8 family serine peptidase [Chloroflexota bacterium]
MTPKAPSRPKRAAVPVAQAILLIAALFAAGAALAADPPGDWTSSPSPSPEASSSPSPSPEPTVSFIVTFISGTSASAQTASIAAVGGTDVDVIAPLRMHAITLPQSGATDGVAALRADPAVALVEGDAVRAAEATPNDAAYGSQWSLPQIGWDQAYGTVTPTGTAKVAILDTGVDASHPDLAGQVVSGTSILDGSNGLTDPNGHGTWMAGIIAAATDNGEGIAGVAYAGVQVMPVTVLGADGTGLDSDIIEGVVYAADHGADVILMAFSNPGYSASLQAAIDYAWSKGAVLVAAVGNDGSSSPTYPAGDRGVIGVSATDQSDALWASSNYGADTFIAAPGVSIDSTAPGGGYTSVTGTSAAAAEVAAAAALAKAVDPSASNGVIVGRLGESADAVGTADQTGNGRLNLARAVSSTSTTSVVPTGAPGGGPFVGPYVAAATNRVMAYVAAGTGSGTVTFARISGDTPDTFTGSCSLSGSNASCSGSGTFQYKNKDHYRITATAAAGSVFTGWSAQSGALTSTNCGGTTNPCPSATTDIELDAAGGSGITATFNVAGPTKLAFTTSAFTGVYGQCIGPITVQTQNASNVATNVTSSTTVNLATDATGTFSSGATCATSITNVVIATGNNSGTFYYRAGTVGDGTHQLTASATGLTSASQNQAINRATLDVNAVANSKTYGASDPSFAYTLSGFQFTEDATSAGVTGSASCTRTSGETVAGSPYTITCTPGTLAAANYSFATGATASFTINRAEALVNYIGETIFVSSGGSSTTAQVTLTASLQAVDEDYALGAATVSFIDVTSGKVLAANVPVSPVAGYPNVGTANTIVTLSTGQYGAESYLIRVEATDNYTNDAQPTDDKTATVVAMKPTTTNTVIGGGTIDPSAPAGTYSGDLAEDVTFSVGMQYNKSGTNPQGKITLAIPQADGSIVYVKSNSISSMKVTGTTDKTATIYTKASVYRVDGGVVTTLDGGATLRLDVLDKAGGTTLDEVGFTVLSSKTSTLFYSNRWVLDSSVWKTRTQTLVIGTITIG